MPKKAVIKRKRCVKRASTPKYTALVHGRKFRQTKSKKPYYDEFGFLHDKHGRIRGTYLDGFFYPD